MSENGPVEDDPLAGWDPRRRAALERIRRQFKEAGGENVSLVDELIAERRLEAAAEDGLRLSDDVIIEHRRQPGPAGE
jgi:hypothetical protein